MAFNGTGNFVRVHNWTSDKAAGIKISDTRNDAEDTGIAEGLSEVLCKDGQQTTTAPISFAAGVKISDGTVGAPHASFINDPDTGFYRIGTNNLGIAAGGSKVIDVSTAAATGVAITGSLVIATALAAVYGGTGLATTNSVRVYNSSGTAIANNTNTVLTFDTEIHDTNGLHSTSANTSRLTAVVAGTYIIVGNVRFEGIEPATNYQTRTASILKNGTTYLAQEYRPDVLVNKLQPLNVVAVAQLAVDDYVQLEVAQTNNDSMSCSVQATAGISPIFSMVRVSA